MRKNNYFKGLMYQKNKAKGNQFICKLKERKITSGEVASCLVK